MRFPNDCGSLAVDADIPAMAAISADRLPSAEPYPSTARADDEQMFVSEQHRTLGLPEERIDISSPGPSRTPRPTWIRSFVPSWPISHRNCSSPGAPTERYDLFVVLPRDAQFGMAHLALDMLATTLSDWFGWMRLVPPTAYQSEVMLHARVGAPAVERIRLLLESVLEAVMLEVLGAETTVETAARLRKTRAAP